MVDVWIGDFLLLLAIPATMVSTVQRIRPRLLAGDGIVLEDLEILQAEYRKRYVTRLWLLRVAPAQLAIYFILRVALWPPDMEVEGPSLFSFLIAAFAVYVGTMIGTAFLRMRHERSFVVAHPIFADSFLPVRPRVFAVLPWILSVGALTAGIVVGEQRSQLTLIGFGFIGLFIGTKLRYRQISHSRYELPWDEPMGKRISEVVERFGRTPKKLVLIPSLVTNAGAMPDGTVFVTSALRTRPAEFKCDADAAKLGLGLELASCLNKITRFMGQPSHWIGIDRFLITHPSLEERVARLISAAKESG